MNRIQAEDYIYASYLRAERFQNYESKDSKKRNPALTKAIIDSLNRTPCVLITGSKGKGSVANMISQILQSRHRVGLMTSPHITAFNERFRVNNLPISDSEFVSTVEALKEPFDQIESTLPSNVCISPMGIQAAIGLLYFSNKHTSYNVFELGKGAKYDDVNNINSSYSVINSIFLEHTRELGETVEKIAEDVLEFKKKSTVYISYTHNDEGLYTQLASMLRDDWDFAVFDPKQMATGTSFSDTITSTMDNALTSGMIIFVITESFVKSPWCIKELSYVIDRVKLKDEVHNVLLLQDEKLNSDSMSQLVLNDKIPVCKIKILDGKLMIDSRRLYWEFMREQISEGVRRKDPNALFILADHFYWDDDRFDNYNTRGMRVAAAKMAKEAAEKGHPSAQHLYEMIISDYPEIENEIK